MAVYMASSCSFLDSGPSYDILDLADVANVFVANSISQSVVSDIPWIPQLLRGFSFSSSSSYRITSHISSNVPVLDVQLSHQRFGGRPDGPGMSGFPFFAIFASRLSSILFTWSLHARFLILVHPMTFWISQMSRISSSRILFPKYCQWCISKSSFPHCFW